MSIKAQSHVWEHSPAKGSDLLILLAIADFADDDGVAWPSIETLAKKSRLSRRQAQYNVRSLVSAGLLAIDENAGPHGTHRYRVLGVQGLHGAKSAPVQSATRRGAKSDTKGVQPIAPEPSVEPSTTTTTPPTPSNVTTIAYPAQQPHVETKSRSRKTSDPNFDRFWDAYPNTDEKKKAVEIWAKLKPNDELVETILAAVERQKKTRKWQEGFVKVAFRWLRDENWTDGGVKETTPAGPAGVDLLPGEVAKETEPGHWELSRGDQKRYVSPEWHGVVWDPNVYRGSDGTKAFREAVADAKRKHEQEAA